MTKLKTDAITDSDLADFVASDSDFAFEMQVITHFLGPAFASAFCTAAARFAGGALLYASSTRLRRASRSGFISHLPR